MQLKLYLIEILHQTTTSSYSHWCDFRLYLIEILHQTTTRTAAALISIGCILSKFYIKPQLPQKRRKRNGVVSYRNSTSNHNWKSFIVCNLVLYLIEILHQTTTAGGAGRTRKRLYLIEILHQTTTLGLIWTTTKSCILSKFYIKPQLPQKRRKRNGVVSYRNSTSNHNWKSFIVCNLVLYLIEILHQTTTAGGAGRTRKRLYLIEILHQTTTSLFCYTNTYCCILSKFYIKPQLCP